MVRRKLPLEFIKSEKSRKKTFRSRKNNLMKKAHEFRTLCGVSTCVIIYNPEEQDHDKTETYPPDHEGVVEVIKKYKDSSAGRKTTVVGVPKVFETRKKKLDTELNKAKDDNRNAKYPLPPRDLIENILSKEDVESLYEELSVKIAVAKNRQAEISNMNNMTDNLGLPGTGMCMNLMEYSPIGNLGGGSSSNYLMNQLGGGGGAWSTSNPPLLYQYLPGQDQYTAVTNQTPPMMLSVGNPNNIDYTWPLLQDPTLFCNNPLPLAMQLPQGAPIQYPVSTSIGYGPSKMELLMSEQSSSSQNNNNYYNTLLHDYCYGGQSFYSVPPLTVTEQSSSSHTFRYGVSGSGVSPPSSALQPLPSTKPEWSAEQSSSSHTSFLDQF